MRLTDLYEKYHLKGEDLRMLAETGWLSVEAGLPDPYQSVLCCVKVKNKTVHAIGFCSDGKWTCLFVDGTVTHWTILPELPA